MYEGTAAALQPVGTKGRILLLARDPELGRSMRNRQFQVSQLEDPEDLSAQTSNSFDLVMMDSALPESASPEFRARLESALPGVPVVLISPAPTGDLTELSLDHVEKLHITKVLAMTNGNFAKTARWLSIDRTTLYNKVKRYGLSR